MIDFTFQPLTDEEKEIMQNVLHEMSEQEFEILFKYLMPSANISDEIIDEMKVISRLSFRLSRMLTLNELKEQGKYVN